MRIVAGQYRGRAIVAPKGDATRPTSDRVREATFSALIARGLLTSDDNVLDLFAGSGALGLEALSRGVARATFVEQDRHALEALNKNIGVLGAENVTAVIRGDSFLRADGKIAGGPFTLLFLDPPYRIESSEVRALIDALFASGLLVPHATVVWEHAARTEPELSEDWGTVFTKRYGSTAVTIAFGEGGSGRQ